MSDVPELDVRSVADAHERGAPLIDVREEREYAEAHAPGAVLIPLGQVADRVSDVPTGGPVYVICRSGRRSATAVAHYRQHGIDAVNVTGGTLAWIEAGLPVDSGSGATG